MGTLQHDGDTFNPNLLNPLLWYRSDRGVTLAGNKVSQWSDLSGNNIHLTQSDDARRPLYVATGYNGGVRPLLRFDGTAAYMATALISQAQPTHVFIRTIWSSFVGGAYNHCIIDGYGSNSSAIFRLHDSNVATIYAGASGPALTVPTSADQIIEAYFSGASSIGALNGETYTDASNAGTSAFNGLTLCCHGGSHVAERCAPADVVEVIVFTSFIPQKFRDRLIAYMQRG